MVSYFAVIPLLVVLFFGIEGIQCGKEALMDDVVSKMIEEMESRGVLDGVDQNIMGGILQGF